MNSQAISSIKEREDAFERIGEALDFLDIQKFTPDCGSSVMKSAEQANGGAIQNPLSSTSATLQRGYASSQTLHDDSDRIEAEIPSELITSCVATLLMLQVKKERSKATYT